MGKLPLQGRAEAVAVAQCQWVGISLLTLHDYNGEVSMKIKASGPTRYALSFTSGALLMKEAVIIAPVYLRERDWLQVRELVEANNLLQTRTMASSNRLAREVVQRLAVLSDDEIEVIVDATATERGHLLWAAACRRYGIIGEFAEDVLRERFLLMVGTLDYDDFDSFIRGKALWHEEVAGLKHSTLRKLRTNLFRMLVEAGLLAEDGRILHATLSERVALALDARVPSDVRYFPAGNRSVATRAG